MAMQCFQELIIALDRRLSIGVQAAMVKIKNAKASSASKAEKSAAEESTPAVKTAITFGSSKVTKALNAKGTKTKRIRIRKGQKLKLKAKALDGGKLTYKSSNKKVAAVSKQGVIKAVKQGACTILVKSGKAKVKVLIEVTK